MEWYSQLVLARYLVFLCNIRTIVLTKHITHIYICTKSSNIHQSYSCQSQWILFRNMHVNAIAHHTPKCKPHMQIGKMLYQTSYYPYLQLGIMQCNLLKTPLTFKLSVLQGVRTEHRLVFPFRITTSDTDMPIPLFDSSKQHHIYNS